MDDLIFHGSKSIFLKPLVEQVLQTAMLSSPETEIIKKKKKKPGCSSLNITRATLMACKPTSRCLLPTTVVAMCADSVLVNEVNSSSHSWLSSAIMILQTPVNSW